jgi:hypothetical protein
VLADRIADAVEDRLRQQHRGESTLYRRELGICVGAGRIDVAAVNGVITGCEVKSARDGLGRLPQQIELYGKVVDTAILVVERVRPRRVAAQVPEWWGVWHAIEENDELVRLDVLRDPSPNPDVEPFAVAQLLWRDEAYDALRQLGLHPGLSSATRWQLWEVLAAELPLDVLRHEVRWRLKARRPW